MHQCRWQTCQFSIDEFRGHCELCLLPEDLRNGAVSQRIPAMFTLQFWDLKCNPSLCLFFSTEKLRRHHMFGFSHFWM